MSSVAPVEFQALRGWLEQVFAEASQGLPWQEQLLLRAVEHGLAAGMLGLALSETWRLRDMHRAVGAQAEATRLDQLARALETLAFGPLGPVLTQAWSSLAGLDAACKPLVAVGSSGIFGVQGRRPPAAGTPIVVR